MCLGASCSHALSASAIPAAVPEKVEDLAAVEKDVMLCPQCDLVVELPTLSEGKKPFARAATRR